MPTTIADKRFNKSTGNFTDEQQMAAANGAAEHLQRTVVGVSQPIQRRRPPPPPIPTSNAPTPVLPTAMVAVPAANTQNVSTKKRKSVTSITLPYLDSTHHSNELQVKHSDAH